ncbi:hypothetical protein ACQEVB_20825 [Pseudonocardia sp. CA-107938]|uniref:hypothetical protein n=1 Tax=Pseudonocardia sp. CA-107938 TaxID=3240021 RepID=UPI003D89BA59
MTTPGHDGEHSGAMDKIRSAWRETVGGRDDHPERRDDEGRPEIWGGRYGNPGAQQNPQAGQRPGQQQGQQQGLPQRVPRAAGSIGSAEETLAAPVPGPPPTFGQATPQEGNHNGTGPNGAVPHGAAPNGAVPNGRPNGRPDNGPWQAPEPQPVPWQAAQPMARPATPRPLNRPMAPPAPLTATDGGPADHPPAVPQNGAPSPQPAAARPEQPEPAQPPVAEARAVAEPVTQMFPSTRAPEPARSERPPPREERADDTEAAADHAQDDVTEDAADPADPAADELPEDEVEATAEPEQPARPSVWTAPELAGPHRGPGADRSAPSERPTTEPDENPNRFSDHGSVARTWHAPPNGSANRPRRRHELFDAPDPAQRPRQDPNPVTPFRPRIAAPPPAADTHSSSAAGGPSDQGVPTDTTASTQSSTNTANGRPAVAADSRTPPAGLERFVADDRAQAYAARWAAVKSEFVDEPRDAVRKADALVGELLDDIARGLATQRAQLDRGIDGDRTSTEDLRLAMHRYRDFFDRLLKF